MPSVEPNCRSSYYRLVLPSASPLILKVMLILLPPIIPHALLLVMVPFIIITYIIMPCGVDLDVGDGVKPSVVDESVPFLGMQVGPIRRCKEYTQKRPDWTAVITQ